MQKWIKFVPRDQLIDGAEYFLGRHRNKGDPYHEDVDFLGKGLNGKQQWTCKPGIAIRAICNEKFRKTLEENPDLVAVEIPKDAATRWKARKRKF